MSDSPLSATVLITTKDRKAVLARAIDSVLKQTVSLELIVVDDGSSDGTSELVSEQYPQVKLLRNEQAQGIITARNNAAQIATGDILFVLDDDAEFRTNDVVATVLADFAPERVGVVSIPYLNHYENGGEEPRHLAEGREAEDFLCHFYYPGGSSALRLRLFLALDGYSGTGRQAEEQTYSIRLLNSGYVVRASSTAWIDHYPIRSDQDQRMVVYWGARNNMEYAFKFIPFWQLLTFVPAKLVNYVRLAIRRRMPWSVLRGVVRGTLEGLIHFPKRQAVSTSTYHLMREMIVKPRPYSEVEKRLPPPRFGLS